MVLLFLNCFKLILVHTVKKLCLPNGNWYTVDRGNNFPAAEWTDYSGCVANSVCFIISTQ